MKKTIIVLVLLMLALGMASTAAFAGGICGEATVVRLLAGQHIEAGNVTVSNDADNLYVKFSTTGDWWLKKTHLHVATSLAGIPKNPGGLIPGQFDYQTTHNPFVQEFTYTIPLTWPAGTELYIAAHAEVVRVVDGEVVQEETGWGEGEQPGRNWSMYFKYTVQECDDNGGGGECNGETAWADGPRYQNPGNWATYTPYVPDSTVTLYAGQTLEAGTVHFSAAVGGQVTITITLNAGWQFQNVAENVKIQDYASAPGGNPVPGLFDHKGNAGGSPFAMVVPENNFYGVHADVAGPDCE